MIHFINRKVTIAKQEGFALFKQNWLLLYNNWSPTPDIGDPNIIPLLNAELSRISPWNIFSRIFILGDRLLLDSTVTRINIHRVVTDNT